MPVPLATHPLVDALVTQQTVAIAVFDRERRYVRVNEALARLNGTSVEEHVGRTVAEVLRPEIVPRVEALIDAVLAGDALVDMELSAVDAEGAERRFVMSCLPVVADAEIAGVLATIVDRTAALRAEAELAAARERLVLALEGTETGTFEYHLATDAVHWSDNLGPLYGRPRGWSPRTYEEYAATIHPDDRDVLAADVRRAAAEGVGYQQEFRAVLPDGSARWRHSQVHVIRGDDGCPLTLVGLVHDIEARKQRERRAEYLARAGLALSQSLDPGATLEHIAELAVGELGDWCSVTLAEPAGPHRTIAVAHRDPERVRFAHTFQERYPTSPDAPTGTPAVIRSGRSELYPVITDAMLAASARDEEHLALIRELDIASMMIVPMLARGRTLGAITFATGRGGRAYDTEDLALAEELGRRAGLALDNARLYETVRGTAVTLQRSLLPAGLPELAGWQIASRYVPGEAGAAVGGDWYDAFALRDGRYALVVGDVMGRGVPAAAGMGRLRSALQAYLHESGDPVCAMERLDDLVADLRVVSFATAVAAVLDPGAATVTICSAGHPPPLLRGASTVVLDVHGGPPVGARDGPRRAAGAALASGDALLLYTDGLVEAREAPLDERVALLARVVEGGPADAVALVDHAVQSMLPSTPPDDVAAIAVRRL